MIDDLYTFLSALLHHGPHLLLHCDSDWPAAPMCLLLHAVPLSAGLQLVQVFSTYAFKQHIASLLKA